jgi:hypothetical protein
MVKKIFTVGDKHAAFQNGLQPYLRFGGAWLKDYGIEVGDRLELIEGKNMLILIKAGTGA